MPNTTTNVVLATAAILAIITTACSSSGSSTSNDPASLLASEDGSSDVASYSTALDAWQAKCTANRVTDAGYVDATYRDEQKNHGPDGSRLVVMQHLTASVPDSAAPTDCAGIAAAYLVLVEK